MVTDMWFEWEVVCRGLSTGAGKIHCGLAREDSPGCWISGGAPSRVILGSLGEFTAHAVRIPKNPPVTTFSLWSVPWNDIVGGNQGATVLGESGVIDICGHSVKFRLEGAY